MEINIIGSTSINWKLLNDMLPDRKPTKVLDDAGISLQDPASFCFYLDSEMNLDTVSMVNLLMAIRCYQGELNIFGEITLLTYNVLTIDPRLDETIFVLSGTLHDWACTLQKNHKFITLNTPFWNQVYEILIKSRYFSMYFEQFEKKYIRDRGFILCRK